MNYVLHLALLSSLISLSTFAAPIQGQVLGIELMSKKLEKAFNKKHSLDELFSEEISSKIKEQQNNLLIKFPNAKWEINSLPNNNDFLEIIVNGDSKYKSYNYKLKSKQIIKIKQKNNKIVDHKIINQESILNSSKDKLKVDIQIPNQVLTGTTYSIDIILEEPLGDSIIAGGLIEMQSKDLNIASSPYIDLAPIGSGGLFKIVRAPLNPSTQTWAAVIVHPDGLISITKKVNVVSELSNTNY